MRNSKRKFERQIIERFISHQSLDLRVKLIDNNDNDPPDFYIYTTDSIISVELTRLMHQDLKQIESFQDKIVSKAQKLFQKKYNEELYVLVNFTNQIMSTKEKSESYFVNMIFELIESIYIANHGREFRVSTKTHMAENEYIHSVSVNNLDQFDHWQKHGAFLVKGIAPIEVEKIISKKSEGIKKYSRPTKEKWLLIAINFGTESSGYLVNKPLEVSKENFDRVFMYQFFKDEFLEIGS